MSLNFFKKEQKKIILQFILLLLVFIITNFFLNAYIVSKSSFEERMISKLGYCNKHGYGFIKKFKKKYNLKNNTYILHDKENYPYPGWVLDQFINPKNFEYKIYINPKKAPINEEIIEKEFNCFITLND